MQNPDAADPAHHHHQRLLTAALALTAVCAQLTTIMAMPTGQEKASWNDEEIKHFLQYLVDHRSEGGEGGNFKAPTFNKAAKHIASYRKAGLVKEGKHLKTKWNAVSDRR